MSTTNTQLDSILQQHRGESNAISSTELANRMGWEDSNGNPQTRFALRDLMERTGLPIGSCSDGYFVVETRAELERCILDLKQRQRGIQERVVLLRESFDDERDPQATLAEASQ